MNKKIICSAIFISLFCFTSFVSAQNIPNPLEGVTDFNILLGRIANNVGIVLASLGTIMIVVAGILYLTSAGNPQRIETAKKALIYAVIGIAIGIGASTIASVACSVIGVSC